MLTLVCTYLSLPAHPLQPVLYLNKLPDKHTYGEIKRLNGHCRTKEAPRVHY